MTICLAPPVAENAVFAEAGAIANDGAGSDARRRPPNSPETELSSDGAIRLEMLVSEWSLSLWTHAPRLIEVRSGKILLDLWGTSWDAQTAWTGGSGLRLDMRRYDRPGSITLFIVFEDRTYRVVEDGSRARPLADIRAGIDRAFADANQRFCRSLSGEDIPEQVPALVGGRPVSARPLDLLGQRGRQYYRNFMAKVLRKMLATVTSQT